MSLKNETARGPNPAPFTDTTDPSKRPDVNSVLPTRSESSAPTVEAPPKGPRDVSALLAIFPLYPIVDGKCACSDPACTNAGKHPSVYWKGYLPGHIERGEMGSGMRTGAPFGIFVLDVDVKDGKNGLDELVKLEGVHGKLPNTWTIATGGGGGHLVFAWPEGGVKNSAGRIAPGLDIRGEGGFVVEAGSLHRSGERYETIAGGPEAVAEAPAWLIDLAGAPSLATGGGELGADYAPVDPDEVDMAFGVTGDERVSQARRSAKNAPHAIEGKGGSTACLVAMGFLTRGYALPVDLAFEIAKEHYNPRCVPPWSDAELMHKVKESTKGPIAMGSKVEHKSRLPEVLAATQAANERAANDPMAAVKAGLGARRAVSSAEKPRIDLGTNIQAMAVEAEEALAADPSIFQRAGKLVRIERRPRTDAERAQGLGTPLTVPLTSPNLKAILSDCADWFAWDAEAHKERKVKPSDDVVAHLFSSSWPSVRPLTGIVETPLMRPDGTILQAPGYDPSTGYYFEPGATAWSEIPESPSRDDAIEAMVTLIEPFEEFPYVDDASALIGIAAILSLVARPAIGGDVPMFIFEASTRGSGKTLQADAVAMVATGRPVIRATMNGDDNENAKAIAGHAMQATPLFCWDNVDVLVGGAALEMALTSNGSVAFRTLGKNNTPTYNWQTIMLATANNVTFKKDVCRRCLISRIEPSVERPELLTDFERKDLKAWVGQNRERLVHAALTVLRAYHVAGRPDAPTLGSYESWSRLIAGAIQWTAGVSILGAVGSDESGSNVDADELRTLLRVFPPKAMTAKEMLEAARPGAGNPFASSEFASCVKAMAAKKDGDEDAKTLGYRLRKHKGRALDGKKLVGELNRDKALVWSVVATEAAA